MANLLRFLRVPLRWQIFSNRKYQIHMKNSIFLQLNEARFSNSHSIFTFQCITCARPIPTFIADNLQTPGKHKTKALRITKFIISIFDLRTWICTVDVCCTYPSVVDVAHTYRIGKRIGTEHEEEGENEEEGRSRNAEGCRASEIERSLAALIWNHLRSICHSLRQMPFAYTQTQCIVNIHCQHLMLLYPHTSPPHPLRHAYPCSPSRSTPTIFPVGPAPRQSRTQFLNDLESYVMLYHKSQYASAPHTRNKLSRSHRTAQGYKRHDQPNAQEKKYFMVLAMP